MSTTPSTTTEQHLKLRAAMDLIAKHPDLPTPMISAYSSGSVDLDWFVTNGEDQVDEMRRIRRIIGGTWSKVPSGPYFVLRMEHEGVRVAITGDREQVCEAIVVGQETVTVPAVQAAPERVEVRDVIEWRCEPLNDTEAVSA